MDTKHVFWQDYFLHNDLHLKLNILNPLNIIFWLNGFKNEFFALQPFPSKFQDFEIFEWLGFSSSSSNEHVLS